MSINGYGSMVMDSLTLKPLSRNAITSKIRIFLVISILGKKKHEYVVEREGYFMIHPPYLPLNRCISYNSSTN